MIPDPRLQPEIGQDETLLWQGAPDPARLAQRNTWLSIFGGCFTLFALIWMLGAGLLSSIIAGATGWRIIALAPLFGLIFLIVGVVMLLSPLTARRRGARTLYALTNRRLIIWEEKHVRSYRSQDLNTLERRDLPNGRGDLIFRRETYQDSESVASQRESGLFGIPNAREVERLIRSHLQN